MESAEGADAVDQDRSHRRRPDPARPPRSDGHARRRVCLPDGPCHNYRIRSMRLTDPSPREGVLWIRRRRRRNDRGQLDISSPNVASGRSDRSAPSERHRTPAAAAGETLRSEEPPCRSGQVRWLVRGISSIPHGVYRGLRMRTVPAQCAPNWRSPRVWYGPCYDFDQGISGRGSACSVDPIAGSQGRAGACIQNAVHHHASLLQESPAHATARRIA
jgi:hypothetical protein